MTDVLVRVASQVPALAVLVLVVVHFLRSAEKQGQRQSERESERDRQFTQTVREVTDACHQNQQASLDTCRKLTDEAGSALRENTRVLGAVATTLEQAVRKIERP